MHELITARTAAAILHCTPRNVIRIAKREHLNVIEHGNRILYKKRDSNRCNAQGYQVITEIPIILFGGI